MKIVVGCLLTLQAEFTPNNGGHNSSTVLSCKSGADANRRWKLLGENFGCGDVSYREEFSRTQSSPSPGERQKNGSDSKFQRALRSPVMAGIVVSFSSQIHLFDIFFATINCPVLFFVLKS